MAIQKGVFNNKEGNIKLTNGDLAALKKIATDYGIASEEDVVSFALGILSRAEGGTVSIELKNGSVMKFMPADKLRKSVADA